MINVFLTNLGKYNEGELVGEWVSLPATDTELEEVLERIGISDEPDEDGNYYEEYFITDYECDVDGVEIDEYSNLEELNELAEELEALDKDDLDIIEAIMAEGYTFESAMDIKDDCMIYYNCSDMTEVAMEYAEETGLLSSIPENLQYYFDFESFGRDMSYEGTFCFTNNGHCVQIL